MPRQQRRRIEGEAANEPHFMWIKETIVNDTEGYIFGIGDWQRTDRMTLGDLFRSLRVEYGACVSKQYSDRANKPPVQTGWVFRKRMQYEDYEPSDKKRYYMREVWISVSNTPPQKRTVNITSPWDTERKPVQDAPINAGVHS